MQTCISERTDGRIDTYTIPCTQCARACVCVRACVCDQNKGVTMYKNKYYNINVVQSKDKNQQI